MTEKYTQQQVLKIVDRITGGRATGIHPGSDLKTALALDSVQIVELFAALEKEFGVELPLHLMEARTGKEFLETLEASITKHP